MRTISVILFSLLLVISSCTDNDQSNTQKGATIYRDTVLSKKVFAPIKHERAKNIKPFKDHEVNTYMFHLYDSNQEKLGDAKVNLLFDKQAANYKLKDVFLDNINNYKDYAISLDTFRFYTKRTIDGLRIEELGINIYARKKIKKVTSTTEKGTEHTNTKTVSQEGISQSSNPIQIWLIKPRKDTIIRGVEFYKNNLYLLQEKDEEPDLIFKHNYVYQGLDKKNHLLMIRENGVAVDSVVTDLFYLF